MRPPLSQQVFWMAERIHCNIKALEAKKGKKRKADYSDIDSDDLSVQSLSD